MNSDDLIEIEKIKYNTWGSKKELPNDDEKRKRARPFLGNRNLPRLIKSAFFFHEMTGCNGFEFFAYSNISVNAPIFFPNNIILVPCFYSDDGSNEHKIIDDPRFWPTLEMWEKGELLFDGWIEINQWDENNVSQAIQSISECLSIFSLNSGNFCKWEPKYQIEDVHPFSKADNNYITNLGNIINNINKITEKDRRAIYRSLSWLSQGKLNEDPPAKFLFFILSIESFAAYIENEAKNTSFFSQLRSRDTKDEIKEWRENCIKEKLDNLNRNNPEINYRDFIESCYFDYVNPIKQTIIRNLSSILGDNSKVFKLLFDEKIDGKTLYDIRNQIAHGGLDLLTEKEILRINDRLWDTEKIAVYYLSQVLKLSEINIGMEFYC